MILIGCIFHTTGKYIGLDILPLFAVFVPAPDHRRELHHHRGDLVPGVQVLRPVTHL